VGRERKLGDQKRGGGASKTETETDERSSANEHADVLGSGLDGDTDKHDHGTKEDGLSSADTIAKVGSKGEGADTTDRLQKKVSAIVLLSDRDTHLNGVEDTK
jgi:hypothetical protein